jgi:hypothetical protein
MGQTLPDVILDGKTFQDINTATGIPVGSAVTMQFKNNYTFQVQFSDTQPAVDSQDGFTLKAFDLYQLGLGDPKIWVKGNGRLSVQAA